MPLTKNMKGKKVKNLREVQEYIAKQNVRAIDSALSQFVKSAIDLLGFQGKNIEEYALVNVMQPMELTEDGARINSLWRIVRIDEVKFSPANDEIKEANRFKTVWGLYFINSARTEGYSEFFETYEQALDASIITADGSTRIEKQTYELEQSYHHDCGDEE